MFLAPEARTYQGFIHKRGAKVTYADSRGGEKLCILVCFMSKKNASIILLLCLQGWQLSRGIFKAIPLPPNSSIDMTNQVVIVGMVLGELLMYFMVIFVDVRRQREM